MKKVLKDIKTHLSKAIAGLEEVSLDPKIKSIDIPDGSYRETSSAIILSWLPRGKWMLKKLDAIIDKLPKEPREKKKLTEKVAKPKKVSQRLLQLTKLINPQEVEVIWSSGRKSINSRDELAHIIKEVRKLERK